MIHLDYEHAVENERTYVYSIEVTHDEFPNVLGFIKHIGNGLYRFRIDESSEPPYFSPHEYCLSDALGLIVSSFMSK
jgi:hypothetical protein